MILLREVQITDLEGLEKLSQIAAEKHPGFLNIANDKDQWKEKIRISQESFSDKIKNKTDSKFVFVAEDLQSKRIVGLSMIASQHGTPETPHFFFEVANEQKFSQTINTGFIHGTLKLKYETNGPSEVGGLLVDPELRNHESRIGKQISLVRFLYVAMHKQKFKRRIIAELLPPLTKKGKSPLWEAVGRRFTNMDYTEADILSGKNKEFILSLFPTGKIYVTFLSAEARNAIGKVSKDTEPVMHMLKKIGFEYKNQVDPFDGGPHLIANVDDISVIKKTKLLHYTSAELPSGKSDKGLLTTKQPSPFQAVSGEVFTKDNQLFCVKEISSALHLKEGDPVFFMPYY